MEKISRIVRGNSRVASVDMKSSPGVRPGAPGFGRPQGEAVQAAAKEQTTAMKAAALHAELNGARKSSQDRVIEALADEFFMARVRRPEVEAPSIEAPELATGEVSPKPIDSEAVEALPPSGYTPRGSYVDVRA